MTLKGVEMASIHEETIDGDMYLKVLEEEHLPLMNPWPGDFFFFLVIMLRSTTRQHL
jgi:hypothetical protein